MPSTEYTEVIPRSALVMGGRFVSDPVNENLLYYVAPNGLRFCDRANFTKAAGLLVSGDGGETWRVVSRQFDFDFLFVHPATGKLYAIIDYEWQKTEKDGFLYRCFANKVVMSDDGHRWTDITRGPGYVAELVSIFQDPQHPKRICVVGCVIRSEVIQYTDDEYSDWKWTPQMIWSRLHPATRPSR